MEGNPKEGSRTFHAGGLPKVQQLLAHASFTGLRKRKGQSCIGRCMDKQSPASGKQSGFDIFVVTAASTPARVTSSALPLDDRGGRHERGFETVAVGFEKAPSGRTCRYRTRRERSRNRPCTRPARNRSFRQTRTRWYSAVPRIRGFAKFANRARFETNQAIRAPKRLLL